MPTGPFRNLGTFEIKDHQGNVPKNGPSSKIKIVKATSKYIKYTRKDASRINPVIHHAKIQYAGNGTWIAHLGGFQTISIRH